MLAETVPVTPGAGQALLALSVFVGFIVLYGLVVGGHKVIDVLFWPLTKLANVSIGAFGFNVHPFRFLNEAKNAVDHFLGNAAHALEGAIAWQWHTLAVIVHWAGREIRLLAGDTYHALVWFQRHYLPLSIGTATRPIAKQAQHATALSRQQARMIARAAAAAAATATLPYWRWRRWADRAIGQSIPAEIAAVDAYAGTLARRLAYEQRRVSRLEKILAALGLAALVGIGLNKLDLGHLRCKNNRNFGKLLCRAPLGLLEGLLGGAVEVLLVLDICRIARFATRAAVLAEPLLRKLVVVIDAALCGGTRQRPPALAVRGQPWPTPVNPIAL